MKTLASFKAFSKFTLISFLLFTTSACENPIKKAARNATYSAYEIVGVQKRDLLKNRVDDARDEQKQAGEDFQDALTKLKSVYGFKGGELEKHYDQLKSSFEKAKHQADDVHKSVSKVETVAKDLFKEWENEIEEIKTESLRDKSRQSLASTKERYGKLHASLKASEAKMDPVLTKFNDYVLYLKHNLNAQAIASLKGEAVNIQGDIESLIKDMNKSIDSADQFIKQME